MKQPLKQNLQQQLIEFGLKPSEWNLEIKKTNLGLIKHKFENNFEFKGAIKNEKGKYSWANLQLHRI